MIGVFKEIQKNRYLYLLALPGILFLVIFAYVPLVGHVLAFEDYRLSTGLFGSAFVGFDNFKFFFGGRDWITVTKNTLVLNSLFLGIGLTFSLVLAVFINEMRNVSAKKLSQSFIFLPYFISWQVISIMIYAVLNSSTGFMNQSLHALGLKPVNWYGRPELWPAILTFANIFKYAGYNSIIFLATIVGISEELFESARIDGATRFQQVLHVTLPLLRPIFIIMLLMGIGRIFYGDFGMIYGIVGDNGVLFPTTDVIDTYSYRTLRQVGNLSMSSAVVLYQSVMGIITIIAFNWVVRRIEPDVRLF
ncbi:MAG: ABC transporter permease subunit [Spirochaetes bacterium]|nr:ABC transporter permease subunit [Spirochaetota bacterium]